MWSDYLWIVLVAVQNGDVVAVQGKTLPYYGRPLLPPPELDELDELDELLELEALPPPLLPPEECDDDPDELEPE